MQNHILDNPVWASLQTLNAQHAIGTTAAKRFKSDISPLCGTENYSEESLKVLADLCLSGEELSFLHAPYVTLPSKTSQPPNLELSRKGVVWQLVNSSQKTGEVPSIEYVDLGYDDRMEMLALTQLTQPGPFAENSYLFGGFVGVRENGHLIAMAGERLKLPGYTEVSAVCTHPEFQGRGYAKGLSAIVTNRIISRGDTVFIHSYETNAAAIHLYQKLGFKKRTKLNHMVAKKV